ncbi:hypothetical protein BKA70DRAFT_1268226 [Coprinopsis sp. MPI-PUGE-AT-0042]|nr:hypothetical protein BKA70DRAFT_1268226 [Coprinopsis sp. MPI-PUGE-AT-0042]
MGHDQLSRTMLFLILFQLLFSGLRPIEGAPLEPANSPALALTPSNSTLCPVCEVQYDKNYRSIRDILWACLSVVFACTWTAVHPNVYGYGSTQWQRTKRRILLFLLALFMPEVTLTWSVRQWIGARDITKRMNEEMERMKGEKKERARGNTERTEGSAEESAEETPCLENASEIKSPASPANGSLWVKPLQQWRSRNESKLHEPFQWTDTHSQFLQMGGYVFKFKDGHSYVDMVDLFKSSSSRNKHAEAMREALLQRQDRVEELMDRSKTNLLARTIAYSQMLWFCTNFVGRLAEGLTITKLEVASLAYVAMTLAAYYFWMDKPLDVDCPIIVAEEEKGSFGNLDASPLFRHINEFTPFPDWDSDAILSHGTLIAIGQSVLIVATNVFLAFCNATLALFRLVITDIPKEWRSVDNRHADQFPFLAFWEAGVEEGSLLASTLSAFSYAAFGGIHCIAWNFAPYSEVERWLWRVASLTVAAVPLLFPCLLFLASIKVLDFLMSFLVVPIIFLGAAVFIPARVVILVLPFLELTHLPADAFKTVSWDDFFPHIG